MTLSLTSIVHTRNWPKPSGERHLAQKLAAFPNPELHFWFALDALPGVPDIDLLAYHAATGLVLIEVKAVSIQMVEEFGFSHCKIAGRDEDSGPVNQAGRAFRGLKNFLGQSIRNVPFITVTACWPEIWREDWNDRWDNEHVTGRYADSVLFRDDVESGPAVLIQRLRHIVENPPKGSAPLERSFGRERRIPKELFERLSSCLVPDSRPRATVNERTRLKHLEDAVSNELKKQFPPGGAKRIVLKGLPGTGKTFRLLQIGLWHAANSERVLFSCYNKTLAADLRRLLQLSPVNSACKYPIEVRDVFELASECCTNNDLVLGPDGGDYNEWGQLVVSELRGRRELHVDKFNSILIDESQDMEPWHLALLELHQAPSATVCCAFGRGQELYGGRTEGREWLSSFEETELRRNFRNARKVYYAAHAFFEAYPNREGAIDKSAKRFLKGVDSELEFDFDGRGSTAIRYLPVAGDDWAFVQGEMMAQEYKAILAEEIGRIRESETLEPVDLLILVPSPESVNTAWARSALDLLKVESRVQYIDYTQEELRRVSPGNEQVRLCNFHSARGLEGAVVVVFGLESIERLAQNIVGLGDPLELIRSLGFVVLSRAIHSSTIAIRPELNACASIHLLTKILSRQAEAVA